MEIRKMIITLNDFIDVWELEQADEDVQMTIYKEDIEVFKGAIKTLEKQIPAKLIDRSGWYSGHYLCPTCNKIYWKDEIVPNYCQDCGQKFCLD